MQQRHHAATNRTASDQTNANCRFCHARTPCLMYNLSGQNFRARYQPPHLGAKHGIPLVYPDGIGCK
ncbi:MAG: hypothetical protein Kow00105_03270 [Phycisphaeraceae bacterium]